MAGSCVPYHTPGNKSGTPLISAVWEKKNVLKIKHMLSYNGKY